MEHQDNDNNVGYLVEKLALVRDEVVTIWQSLSPPHTRKKRKLDEDLAGVSENETSVAVSNLLKLTDELEFDSNHVKRRESESLMSHDTEINNTAAVGNEAGALSAVLKGKTTADWLAEQVLGRVKKAGSFLDGCKIYLSGFSEPHQVQLSRVLKFAGGVRLT